MKRDIKFRAWNKETETMIDWEWLMSDRGQGSDGLIAILSNTADTNHLTLMQYTGLKDKNGREIFEGDIIKQEGLVCEVKWSDFDAGFVFEDDSGSQMIVTSGNSTQWEITGNIWES